MPSAIRIMHDLWVIGVRADWNTTPLCPPQFPIQCDFYSFSPIKSCYARSLPTSHHITPCTPIDVVSRL